MFFHTKLEYNLLLHPQHLGPRWEEVVRKTFQDEVQGTCDGKHGFIIAVLKMTIAKGRILPGRGHVLFPIKYDAIVFRPFKDEVIDAVIVGVTKFIPNMMYDPESGCFKSEDETDTLELGDGIRVRIISTSIQATSISAVATMAGNYLGLTE